MKLSIAIFIGTFVFLYSNNVHAIGKIVDQTNVQELEEDEDVKSMTIEPLQDALEEISAMNGVRAEGVCADDPTTMGDKKKPNVSSICVQKYMKFYSKEKLDFRVVFGYADDESVNEPVFDRAELSIFIQQITSKCEPNIFVCGFTRDEDDATKFYKTVVDPLGNKHIVTLYATNASVSASNKMNNGVLKEEQKLQTEKADQLFFEGAKTADALVYIGHARDGGGPDFGPAVRLKNGAKDYHGYYRTKKPGLNRLLDALKERKDGGPSFIALAACSSRPHFYNSVKKVAPESGFLLSTKTALFSDVYAAAIGSLDSILGQRCQKEFKTAVERPKSRDDNSVHLYDFFRK